MPEGQYHLAEATLYLATAPKSNSVGAYWEAKEEVEKHGFRPPPIYLRDENTTLAKERESAPAYKYPHDFPGGWVAQRYLPEGVKGGWFKPQGHGYEARILEKLEKMKKQKK
jgi:putative ATPase